ncbi:hypothetical protein L9F63_015967, partial [Diploptera punctata]
EMSYINLNSVFPCMFLRTQWSKELGKMPKHFNILNMIAFNNTRLSYTKTECLRRSHS